MSNSAVSGEVERFPGWQNIHTMLHQETNNYLTVDWSVVCLRNSEYCGGIPQMSTTKVFEIRRNVTWNHAQHGRTSADYASTEQYNLLCSQRRIECGLNYNIMKHE